MNITSLLQTEITPPMQRTDYIVGAQLLANLHRIKNLKEKNYSHFLVLSDKTVFKLYGTKVISSLNKLNKPVGITVIPPGESWKNLSVLPKIIKSFFQKKMNRKACLVSLGGGVITDLGGFIASIILRGVDAIYLPTTLLSQVDAAIGGKTGVDFWVSKKVMYKNMLGTFYQPEMVISDTTTLTTLPESEILNGLGEMVKYWIGFGEPTPIQLSAIRNNSINNTEIISLCQKIKMSVVGRDPFDTRHIREKLNLGHTIGHAIEGVTNGKLSHGQSVSLGLVAAAKISVLKELLAPNRYRMIVQTVQQLGLPTSIKGMNTDKVVSAIQFDKKAGSFVLVKDIGKLLTDMTVERNLVRQALTEVMV